MLTAAAASSPQVQSTTDPETLAFAHLPMVHSIAQRMWARCPSHIELEELVNAATCGLIEAAQAFDPSRGVSFAGFAQTRIRGAMLDALRKMDWTPRSVLRKRRALAEALGQLETKLGRAAEDREVAEALGTSLDEYHALLDRIRGVRLEPLAGQADGDEDAPAAEQVEDGVSPLPDTVLQEVEAIEALGEAIERLPEKERLVVTLYFYEELTLKEIGAVLRLTEGRICQLKTSALARLQAGLRAYA